MTRTRNAFCTINEYERLLDVDSRAPQREAEIARLTKANAKLREAAKDVLAAFGHFERKIGTLPNNEPLEFWSPAASMVDTEPMAKLRDALADSSEGE